MLRRSIALALCLAACRNSPSKQGESALDCLESGPACGSDGLTYIDECDRAAAGVSLAHLGECAAATCAEACAVGSVRCVSAISTQACELVNGCGAWGAPVRCAQTCSIGTGTCAATIDAPKDVMPIGTACDGDRACGGQDDFTTTWPGDRGVCLRDQGGLAWGTGQCSIDCTRKGRCPEDARCVDLTSTLSICAFNCSPDGASGSGCDDGLVCHPDGVGGGTCLPRCTDASCAALGLACAPDGTCRPCGRSGEACCPSGSASPSSCVATACNAQGRCE